MRTYISIEPVRTLSALLAFGAAIIALIAWQFSWDETLVGIVALIWSTFIALVGSFFVRNVVTPVGE